MSLFGSNLTTPTTGMIVNGGGVYEPVKYAGEWYYNIATDSRTASGDFEFPKNNWSLNTSTYLNVNATALVNPSTTAFALTAPVRGIWKITYHFRGSITVPASSTMSYAAYISAHTLNGVAGTAIGTVATVPMRIAEFDSTITNTATGTYGPPVHMTLVAEREMLVGDTIAPSFFTQASNWAITGATAPSGMLSRISMFLVKQTG